MICFKNLLFLTLIWMFPVISFAAQCDGVVRVSGSKLNSETAAIVAKQLNKSEVFIKQEFRKKNWHIFEVDSKDADQAYLFFSGSPVNSKYVTLWAGAATKNEEKQIYSWVKKNAKGIPLPLAKCFAWYVTNSRGK